MAGKQESQSSPRRPPEQTVFERLLKETEQSKLQTVAAEQEATKREERKRRNTKGWQLDTMDC